MPRRRERSIHLQRPETDEPRCGYPVRAGEHILVPLMVDSYEDTTCMKCRLSYEAALPRPCAVCGNPGIRKGDMCIECHWRMHEQRKGREYVLRPDRLLKRRLKGNA